MKTMHLYLVMGALICTTSLFAQAPERKRERLTDEQRIERQYHAHEQRAAARR